MLKRWMTLLAGSAMAVVASGCFVDVDDDDDVVPGTAEGLLTVSWTVDFTTDPDACSYYALDPDAGMDLELVVYDRGRGVMLTDYTNCEDFGMSVVLPANDYYYDDGEYYYQAEVTMVDPFSLEAVSTTLPLRDIWVGEDTETELDIDFGPDAFR